MTVPRLASLIFACFAFHVFGLQPSTYHANSASSVVARKTSSSSKDWPSEGWTAEGMPNPLTDPAKCGLGEGEEGLLCDPDGYLNDESRVAILGVMSKIRKGTMVMCPSKMVGYPVSVVIISQVAEEEWKTEDKVETFEAFTRTLDTNWKVSDPECDDGVVLILSIGDRYAFIQAAQKSHQLLEESVVANIIDHMKPLLKDGDFNGALLQASENLFTTLQGGTVAMKGLTGKSLAAALIVLVIVCLILAPIVLPLAVLYLVWSIKLCIKPWVLLADAVSGAGKTRSKPTDPKVQDAERDLQRVEAELEREELDQTMCPICLEDFGKINCDDTVALECQHRYHRKCIGSQLTEEEACPLCWDEISMDIADVDEARSEEHKRRLRFYVNQTHKKHKDVFYGPPSQPYERGTLSGHMLVPQYALYDKFESKYISMTGSIRDWLHKLGTCGLGAKTVQ